MNWRNTEADNNLDHIQNVMYLIAERNYRNGFPFY